MDQQKFFELDKKITDLARADHNSKNTNSIGVREGQERNKTYTDLIIKAIEEVFGSNNYIVRQRGAIMDEYDNKVTCSMSVINTITERKIYIQVVGQRDSGNALERSFRFMMPGIIKSQQRCGFHQDQPDFIPFLGIYGGTAFLDHKINSYLRHAYRGSKENYIILNFETNEWITQFIDHICKYFIPHLEKPHDTKKEIF